MNLRHLAVVTIMATTATAAQQPFELDLGFRITSIQQQAIGDILERPDGKIIVSGRMYDPSVTADRFGNLLEPDGALVPRPQDVLGWYALMGGKIVPWGPDKFYVGNGQGIQRYWLDGTWDSDYFQYDPKVDVSQAGDFHVFPDGRLLLSGNYVLRDSVRGFIGHGYGLVWINSMGTLDTTRIHRYIGPGSTITRLRELSDGRIICGGRLLQYDGQPVPSLIYRVLADGSMDTTFHGPVTTYGYVDYFLEQPSGKVLVTGTFCFEGSPDTLGLIRLLPSGELDPSFNNIHQYRATNYWGQVIGTRQVTAIGDDMLAVTGDFDRIDGEVHGGIVMLDNSGNILSGYFEGSGCGGFFSTPVPEQVPNQFIVGIKPAQDGGYFIYGSYRGYDDGTTSDPSQRLMSKLYGLNVGISEHGAGQVAQLQIAPNPSAGSTVLSTPLYLSLANLEIHDTSGRSVWRATWPAGSSSYTVPAGALAPGTYLVRVQEKQRTLHTGKLVILP